MKNMVLTKILQELMNISIISKISQISTLSLLLITLATCSTHSKPLVAGTTGIDATIDSVIVDHVIEHRDWCRFSRIYIYLSLRNNTNDTLWSKDYSDVDFCHIEKTPASFHVNSDNSTPGLGIVDKSVGNYILPKEEIKIKTVLLANIEEPSLSSINKAYGYVCNVDFFVDENSFFNKGSFHIRFERKNDTKVINKLDDEVIELTDTVSMKKIMSLPKGG